MKIKSKIAAELIQSGLVKPYDIVNHSYTDGGGRNLEKLIISTNGICPTLTTRPDTLGVVVNENDNKE